MTRNIFCLFLMLISLLFCENCAAQNPAKVKSNPKHEFPLGGRKSSKSKPDTILNYTVDKEREAITLKNDSLKKILKAWTQKAGEKNINHLIDFALEISSQQLPANFDRCRSGKGSYANADSNCIAYVSLYNSLISYALTKSPFARKYQSHHYVGQIFRYGDNYQKIFNDPLDIGHDFVLIESLDKKVEIAVVPILLYKKQVKKLEKK